MRAIGYVRVSTNEQAQEGVSVAAQRKAIEGYCELHKLELVEIFEDAGVSAGKALWTRPAGSKLHKALVECQPEKLVALKLDRLFRNAQDCLKTVEELQAHHIDLASVREQIDTSSAMGRFFLTIMAAMAEMELATIRERTQMAMNHLKSEGKRAGQIPFGWKLWEGDGQTLEKCSKEQAVIRQILALRSEGLSWRGITDWLNARDVPAKRDNCRWHPTAVRRLYLRESAHD